MVYTLSSEQYSRALVLWSGFDAQERAHILIMNNKNASSQNLRKNLINYSFFIKNK